MDRSALPAHPAPTRLWEWPTVLSLDAPLVALLWQALFAQTFGVSLTWYHMLLLAAPVWLVYSADRLFDGWSKRPGDMPTRRHRFYAARRWEVAGVWCAVLAASLAAALLALRPVELLGGWVLLAATLGYFAQVHLAPSARLVLPKEVQVALLFGAGVALFLLPNLAALPSWEASRTLPPLALFTLLCALNCALISSWEDEWAHPASLLRYSLLMERLPHAALGLATVASLLALTSAALAPLYVAIVASALALLELNRLGLRAATLRVLGDAALLTPAPVLLLLWLLGG